MVTALNADERQELVEVANVAKGWALDQPALESMRRRARGSDILTAVATRLHREILDSGYCLIREVPTESHAELAAFVGLVSTLSEEGNGGQLFFPVTPSADEDESTDLSSTGASFPFHSDSTYMVRPHEMLGLGCVVNDAAGGDSSVMLAADVADLVEAKAGADALRALGEAVFPYFLRDPIAGQGVQLVPVLWRHHDQWRIRYRSDVLDALLPRHDLSARHLSALEAMRSLLDNPSAEAETRIRLQPHDYLLLDNRRVLHSRTALGDGARELRRSKGYFLFAEDRIIV